MSLRHPGNRWLPMADATKNRPTGGFQASQIAFAAHLRDPDNQPAPADVEERRMRIYRDLFFNNISNFLGGYFPILVSILGEERWRLLARDYYRDHVSETPLFPEMPREFLRYLAEERTNGIRSDDAPDLPYMYELAHFEWVEGGLKLADDDPPDAAIDPDGSLLDQQPVLAGVAWGLSYHYAVDKITKNAQPEGPADEPLHYLVYRNAEDKVIFTQLNVVSARLFAVLDEESKVTGRAALEQIAGELQHPEPETVIASGLGIMEKWRELGVIRGTLPA
jgi:hypothetical protein